MANATARTTLLDNGDFSLHAQLSPVQSPIGGHALTITSKRKESRNPNEEQVRFMACLDREGLTKLGEIIQKQLTKLPDFRTPAQVSKAKREMEEFDLAITAALKGGADRSDDQTP